MPLSSALRFFWCVVWSHGTCGVQTSRRVSADYIWPELRRFPVHPPALPYPNRGVVWRSIQSVFTRLVTPLIVSFSAPHDMCICMLSLVGPSLRCGLFFPRRDANRIQRRLESPCTCSYSLVQPGPVPEYRFYCLSARDTVCPIRCDVEILMAPGGKPSCLTTLPAVRHCQSQCEPTDSQTHLQSDGGLRCS